SPTRIQDPLRRPTARLDHQPRLHRKSDALIVVGFVVIFARCSFSTGSPVVMFGIEPWLSSEEYAWWVTTAITRGGEPVEPGSCTGRRLVRLRVRPFVLG